WRRFPPKVTPPNAGTSGAEEYGCTRAWNLCCSPSKLSILLAKTTVARLHRSRQISPATGVDFEGSQSLYNQSFRHAAASARRRVFEAPSLIRVTRLPTPVGCPGFDGSPFPIGGRDPLGPGCLTGESEERETWTAESLRVAIATEDWALGPDCPDAMGPDETSAVDVSGQHP